METLCRPYLCSSFVAGLKLYLVDLDLFDCYTERQI